ncbi:MAG: hypothetical protein A2341_18835 [Deltaproteobacteria bacterium RIFOXYB12_FULL_58_9]|nr:MAG: hypothetical protein A2341_18835 [Deltaproteobacteria bacterium RIFOXYB12_FULL_58_9]
MSYLRRFWFEGPVGKLEGLLRMACPARAAAVVAHPHPQYGGTMDNPVVFHTERTLHNNGFTTLRFNFRGVGHSDGVFDGRAEVEDFAAAMRWLTGVAVGLPLLAVGYSFGSWCMLRHAERGDAPRAQGLIAIGLPTGLYKFEGMGQLGSPLAVVQGSEDELGPKAEVEQLLRNILPAAQLSILPGVGHLFEGRARDVGTAVLAAALQMLPPLA